MGLTDMHGFCIREMGNGQAAFTPYALPKQPQFGLLAPIPGESLARTALKGTVTLRSNAAELT